MDDDRLQSKFGKCRLVFNHRIVPCCCHVTGYSTAQLCVMSTSKTLRFVQLFIVSDYVRGVTLADWLTGKRPTPKVAAALVAQLADTVQHAHEHGVIHRDLKPGNIMLDDGGHPHIMDFGLAKREAAEITITVGRGEGHRLLQ